MADLKFYTHAQLRGDKLFVRGVTHEGKRVIERKQTGYDIFLRQRDEHQPIEYRDLFGIPLVKKSFDKLSAANRYIKEFSGDYDSHLYYNKRYLYGAINNRFPNKIDYDRRFVRVALIDIECESDSGFPDPEKVIEIINAITIAINNTYTVFGIGQFDAAKVTNRHNETIEYIECSDEIDLLSRFLNFWTEDYPDLVTGWNVFFDIHYIINRIKKLFDDDVAMTMSPYGSLDEHEYTNSFGVDAKHYIIDGISVIDYMELYKKFQLLPRESYKLGDIADAEDVDEKKISYPGLGPAHRLYKTHWQEYIEYNIGDVKAIAALDRKLQFIDLALILAYNAKVNYDDVFGQVKMWECILMNELLSRGIIPEQKKEKNTYASIPGGFVKDVKVGRKKWLLTFDVDSEYPHLMMMLNVSPETLLTDEPSYTMDIDRLIRDPAPIAAGNEIGAFNGAKFRKDIVGIMPDVTKTMYADRKRYKKMASDAKKQKLAIENTQNGLKEGTEYIDAINLMSKYGSIEKSLKVCLNSLYGATANQFFMFYDTRCAAAITLSGQALIKSIAHYLNIYINEVMETIDVDYVTYIDTDSVTIHFGPMVDLVFGKDCKDAQKICDFLSKVGNQKIIPKIKEITDDFARKVNANENLIAVKIDAITETAYYLGKKMYVYNVMESEGVRYKNPEKKILGLTAIKRTTPKIVREKISGCIDVLLVSEKEDVVSYINKFKSDFKKLSVKDISFPKKTSDMEKYAVTGFEFMKGTPIHVKAALTYNNLLIHYKLDHKYPLIKSGDTVRYFDLVKQNPLHLGVVGFLDDIPEELMDICQLQKYCDYDGQFRKSFFDPVEKITKAAGIDISPQAELVLF